MAWDSAVVLVGYITAACSTLIRFRFKSNPVTKKLSLFLSLIVSTTVLADSRLKDLLIGTESTPALSGLQVSVMKNGEMFESHALGFAQIEGSVSEALRIDHKLRVASISKIVVAIGVMQLVDKNLLELDRDISDYLGWILRNPKFPQQEITARQLLSHTSSVRDGPRYFIEAGEGALKDFFNPESDYWDAGAHFTNGSGEEPGQYFVYSNLNFGVLGEVIERISGRRFDLYMEEEVLVPMGLTARFDPCAVPISQLAAAFRKRPIDGNWAPDGPWVAQVDAGSPRCFYGMQSKGQARQFLDSYEIASNASLFSPQGGLRASANELLVLLKMLANGGTINQTRILSASSVEAMLEPQWTLNEDSSNGLSAGEAEPGGPYDGLMTSYGLSVHRIDFREYGFDRGPNILFGHLGEAYGILSHALFDPETGDGIATIITGTSDDPSIAPGHSPLYRVEEEILRWWLNKLY